LTFRYAAHRRRCGEVLRHVRGGPTLRHNSNEIGMVAFVQWLQATPFSQSVRKVSWLIPLLQTIHILAIAMVLSSVIMIDLRIWGFSRSQTLVETARRFLPWIWTALILLTVSGIVLIIAAPRRTLLDPTFQVKMLLMVLAIAPTLAFQLALRRSSMLGEGDKAAGVIGVAALMLWLAVTLAGRGRWIASII
jgi:hypothetical protein